MQTSVFFDCVRHISRRLLWYCGSKRTIAVLKQGVSHMKQMNIRAEAALLEVARRHHTTVEEVRREIRLAMAMAMCNPDPAARKIWGEIPCDGNVLTPEDLITYAAMRCRKSGC